MFSEKSSLIDVRIEELQDILETQNQVFFMNKILIENLMCVDKRGEAMICMIGSLLESLPIIC